MEIKDTWLKIAAGLALYAFAASCHTEPPLAKIGKPIIPILDPPLENLDEMQLHQ